MTSILSCLLAATLLTLEATAHSHIEYVVVNGLAYPGFVPKAGANNRADSVGWAQTATDDGFVGPPDYTTPDIICHRNGTPSQAHLPVSPGDKIHMQWNGWPASHNGPILSYLAPCDSSNTNGSDGCASVDKTKLEFFKIDDSSPVFFNDSAVWSTNTLIASNNSWLVGLPPTLSPGAYVLRHELIALHYANETGGAQNYPQCVNLWVTASEDEVAAATPAKDGTADVDPLTKKQKGYLATELYHSDDPGIEIDIYKPLQTYQIPGPSLASNARPVPVSYQSNMLPTAAGTPVLVSGTTAGPFPGPSEGL